MGAGPYLSQVTVSDLFNQELTLDRNQNLKIGQIIRNDPNFNRKPDYWLNIFNTSPVEFIRHRPVDFPTIKIMACPRDKDYVLAVKIPNIINQKIVSPDTGQPSFSSLPGERFATDLLNPANISNDVWANVGETDMSQMHGGGDDLVRRGVFWTVNEVPSADELNRSRLLKERHYRQLVTAAEDLARSGKMQEIGQEAHIAADFLGLNSGWHVIADVPVRCPNCGDLIKQGIKYHASSVGVICVLDWRGAVAAGVKRREDVPAEQRWWDEGDTDPGHPKSRKQ